jgi:hypothetical protein
MGARRVRNSVRGVRVLLEKGDFSDQLSDPHRLALSARPPLPVWERLGDSGITGPCYATCARRARIVDRNCLPSLSSRLHSSVELIILRTALKM